ncbi:hypothetical protein UK23_20785 [Lentzea aerocolonigenes]|uniref:DUF3558 domain-containing protein n=1 Tax=Lentzea aerocolonigenes TaxID=68170 RepID=A0A0F0GVN2_LENAE|nr:hypothetical protein [Lentzea aerocolonigenes]KJK47370.1 hypothetical protein UK23_20785 [Lentzea aerocolonigenes]
MTWPQHPQQPQHPRQGWQQQGWQQPPPGWQPYPQQPPKKSKAPLIIAIIAGVLLLGGVGTALTVYLNVNKDGGEPKRADQLPALCGNISEAALAKARTTNPNGLGSHESEMSGGKSTICSWHQTKGVDGSGYRGVDVYVQTASKMSVDEMLAQHKDAVGVPKQKPLDGLGDQAAAVLVQGNSAITDIWILVRKGDTTVQVDYTGWDAGIFSNKKPDVAEFEAAAKGLAEEMVAKL